MSDSTYASRSVAAVCVAAHECGHAIQDQKQYGPLVLRSTLVPLANFGSTAAWPVFILGLIMSLRPLVMAGIVLFTLAVLFQLVTLPVEFNASARAIKVLESTGMLGSTEIDGAKKVLRAAAMTYVASLAASVLQLLRLIILQEEEETVTDVINTREIVLAVLNEVLEEDKYSHIVLREVLEKYQYLEKRDRSFITRVAEGTLENLIEMDYIISQFSSVKVSRMKPAIRNILRMSVYQLKYMDSVPDSAVCNEGVKLAQRKGFFNLKGFVNGVLRSVARNLDKVKYPDPKEMPVPYLSVTYSMPEWILATAGSASMILRPWRPSARASIKIM